MKKRSAATEHQQLVGFRYRLHVWEAVDRLMGKQLHGEVARRENFGPSNEAIAMGTSKYVRTIVLLCIFLLNPVGGLQSPNNLELISLSILNSEGTLMTQYSPVM